VKKKVLWLGLMAMLLLWPTVTVLADDPGLSFDEGRIFVDEDVSLEPGEAFNGDLGVFNGDLTVPENSVVNGDVFVTDGDIELAGQVNGNLAVINGDLGMAEGSQVTGNVFGMSGDLDVAGLVGGDLAALFGDMQLRSAAVVRGNLLTLSGNIERDTGARVLGDEVSEIPLPRIPIAPERPTPPELPRLTPQPELPVPPQPPVLPWAHQETLGQRIGRFVGRTLTATLLGLVFVGLGVLVVFIWPRATRKVADCISTLPLQSFGLGLLTLLIAAGLEALATVLMIIVILVATALIATVILIPIGLLLILLSILLLLPVPLVLAAAMVVGWVSLADLVGRKVLQILNVHDVKPVGAVFVGMLLTVAVAATLWIVKPVCCAWPFVILLTSAGVGAAIHTRFGSQSCQPSQPATGPDVLPLEAMDEEAGQPEPM
jgi:cytoskeletal protein CcmA (bactofilin family)